MLRYGYDRRPGGIIAASGTLSQIIPPSLVLIILADQLGRIGDIYRAAMVPGFILAGLYIVYIVIMAPAQAGLGAGGRGGRSLLVLMAISAVSAYFLGLWVENNTAPLDERIVVALLFWGATAFVIALVNKALGLGLLSALAERVTFVMIPPLALIFLVLGTIFIGVATPTEGGAMGAVGAILMAVGVLPGPLGRKQHPPLDERIVVALLFWGATAFVIALVNKALGLGLLSALAERVTFVMIPAGADLPGAGHHLHRRGHADRERRHGRGRHPDGGGAPPAVAGPVAAGHGTTTKLSCFVVFILVGSTVFGLTFRAVNGDLWVEHLLTACPAGSGLPIVVSILTFVLAFFLDFFELAFIIVPLLGPTSWA